MVRLSAPGANPTLQTSHNSAIRGYLDAWSGRYSSSRWRFRPSTCLTAAIFGRNSLLQPVKATGTSGTGATSTRMTTKSLPTRPVVADGERADAEEDSGDLSRLLTG